VFRDDEDRLQFLGILGRVVTMFRWKLHAYVLMGNHFHLLVETPEPNLSPGDASAQRDLHPARQPAAQRGGQLLQGRFKGILVEKESHVLELG
jgi:REP element-mobilizing transposase RayT